MIPCTLRPGRAVSAQGRNGSRTISMPFSATRPYPESHIGTLSFWVYRPHLFSSQYANTWFFPDISISTERVIVERTKQRSRSHYIQFYLGRFPKEPQGTWIHLACTYASRKQQHRNDTYFNIWVNGQASRDWNQNQAIGPPKEGFLVGDFIFDASQPGANVPARIAGIHMLTRALHKLEVEAMNEQYATPTNVKVGRYFMEQKHQATAVHSPPEQPIVQTHVSIFRRAVLLLWRLFSL